MSLLIAPYAFCFQGVKVAFIHLALPFGASASVQAYLRLSQALTFLARTMFAIPLESFFDDYFGVVPNCEPYLGAFDVFGTLNSLLHLEIKLAKDVGPGTDGPLLGHEVSLNRVAYIIQNTASRVRNISQAIERALTGNFLSERAAGELAGKSGFALTALYGRVGRAALKPIFARQHRHPRRDKSLNPGLRAALIWLRSVFVEQPPRPILAPGRGRHVVAYTDAAGDGCLAAVLFPGPPMKPMWARTYASPSIMQRMQARKTQINVYEALATILLLTTFATELERRDVVIFVDNASAKGSLVRGFSASADLAAVAAVFWDLVAQGSIRARLEWVPSA